MTGSRRIIVVTTSYPARGDGSEAAGSFVADTCAALTVHRPVTVLAPGLISRCEETSGLDIERYLVPRLPLSLLRAGHPQDWPAIIASLRSGHAALDQLLRQGDVAHILCLWTLPSGYWGAAMQRRYGIPYSVWALGSDIWQLGRMPVIRRVVAHVLKGAHRCYADGELLRQEVETLSGRTCTFLPSTRRLEVGQSSSPRTTAPWRMAYLGRWHPNKGTDLLLDALMQLPQAAWNRIERIRIAGGGPLDEIVRTGVSRLQAAGRPIDLEGYKNTAQAAEMLEWADYVLIPSRIESIPVIFSDAMHCGRPIITTPVGDLPVLIERLQNGICADSVDARAYAKALQHALAIGPTRWLDGVKIAASEFDLTAVAQRLSAELAPADCT